MILASSRLGVAVCTMVFALMAASAESNNERDYVILLEKYENILEDQNLIKILDAVDYKVNRTHKANNVSVELTDDLPEETMFKIDGYELMNDNSYKTGTLNFPPTKVCDVIKNEKCMYEGLVQYSNTLRKECPVLKGTYEISSYLLDIVCLPNSIPGSDRWRFNVVLSVSDKTLYSVYVYAHFKKIAEDK